MNSWAFPLFTKHQHESFSPVAAMARLQAAIKNLVEVYVEYSDGDGKLSKEQLQKIMDKEIDCPEAKVRDSTCSSYLMKLHMYVHLYFSPSTYIIADLIMCSLG